MKTGKISISNGSINLTAVNGSVWLTQHEITDLFGCFVSKVGSNIRAILKSGTLDEVKVHRMIRNGDGNYTDLYNLGMVMRWRFASGRNVRGYTVNGSLSVWRISPASLLQPYLYYQENHLLINLKE